MRNFANIHRIISDPPREFSLMPFWFWNDELSHQEIIRQIDDFEKHGVYGFVIHPRIGLPKNFVWMSEEYLGFCETAIREADKRGMKVILYDEGMYPSGSSSGQIVNANPEYQARCLAKVELVDGELPTLNEDEYLVALLKRRNDKSIAVIDRKVDSRIRGLHYLEDGSEEMPLAADILNPDAVAKFIELVYEKYYSRFSPYFGNTVMAIFTDEPHQLAKCRENHPQMTVYPGTRNVINQVNGILGYDFTPHLLCLWYDDEPDAGHHLSDYLYAISVLHNEVYFSQLNQFCQEHDILLTGHPYEPDNIGALKYFHIPGQDVVLKSILPDHPSALDGSQSTQAKCSSSVMAQRGLRRNLNEFCGGYGHDFTWEEMNWLAKWLLVRGVNLLVPHAFYYSIRGRRVDERPPQLGPHAPWWNRYREHADFCRRLCWLNTDSRNVCHVAILGRINALPWKSAKVLFEHQIDFDYLDDESLNHDAFVDVNGISISRMNYRVLIVEEGFNLVDSHALEELRKAGRIIYYNEDISPAEFIRAAKSLIPAQPLILNAPAAIRMRHLVKKDFHWYMLFNEEKGEKIIELVPINRPVKLYDPYNDKFHELTSCTIVLQGHQMIVAVIEEVEQPC